MIINDIETLKKFCQDWDSLFAIAAIHVARPIDKARAMCSVKIAYKDETKRDSIDKFINKYFPIGDEVYDVISHAEEIEPYY